MIEFRKGHRIQACYCHVVTPLRFRSLQIGLLLGQPVPPVLPLDDALLQSS